MSELSTEGKAMLGAAIYLAGYLATDAYYYINTYNDKFCHRNFQSFYYNYNRNKGYKPLLWPLWLPTKLVDFVINIGDNFDKYKSQIVYNILVGRGKDE